MTDWRAKAHHLSGNDYHERREQVISMQDSCKYHNGLKGLVSQKGF